MGGGEFDMKKILKYLNYLFPTISSFYCFIFTLIYMTALYNSFFLSERIEKTILIAVLGGFTALFAILWSKEVRENKEGLK